MQHPSTVAKRDLKARAVASAANRPRLTPEEFRVLAKARGYSFAALARLWELTPGRVSQLAAATLRPAHFDYALWGLPPIDQAHAVTQRRRDALANLSRPKPAKEGAGAGFDQATYWQSVIEIGAQFISSYEFSEGIPYGCVGTVIARSRNPATPNIRIRFATGYEEDFSLAYLQAKNCPLWPRLFVAQP